MCLMLSFIIKNSYFSHVVCDSHLGPEPFNNHHLGGFNKILWEDARNKIIYRQLTCTLISLTYLYPNLNKYYTVWFILVCFCFSLLTEAEHDGVTQTLQIFSVAQAV